MKKRIILGFIMCLLLVTACGKKKVEKSIEQNNDDEKIVIENKEENKKEVSIIDLNSNSRPYAVVINNYPGAVKVQAGLSDAYMVYEIPVEGGMSRSLALFKDKYPTKIGTVRSARHNFLDYVMENDAIFVCFGWSHYAQDELKNKWKIDYINGLFDSPFWRENPEKLATEHTAYTSLEKVRDYIKNKGYRTTTNVKALLNYSADEINLSSEGIKADTVIIPYSNYYTVKYVYDNSSKTYQRYVNNVIHKDYFTGDLFTAKNIIVVKLDFKNTDDNYYLDLYNTGSGKGYYITNGYAKEITWEKKDRSSKTVYKYLDGTEIKVNDGNTYIMIQSVSKETTIE